MRTHRLGLALLMLLASAAIAHAADSGVRPAPPLPPASAQPGNAGPKKAGKPGPDCGGKVLDQDGKPVPDAEVFLYYERTSNGLGNRLAARAKTGPLGGFRFPGKVVWQRNLVKDRDEKQKYDVFVRHPDHNIFFISFTRTDPCSNLTIKLGKPQKTMVKTVVDTSSHPLAGVKVYLAMLNKPANSPALARGREYAYARIAEDIGLLSGVTDDKGQVTLMGGGSFVAEKDGYVKTYLRNNQAMLYPSAKVTGTVTDPEGKPIPGVPVTYTYRASRLVESEATLTDAQGRYEFKNVAGNGFRYAGMSDADSAPEGSSIMAEDMRPESSLICQGDKFELKPGEEAVRNLRLTRGLALAGQVINEKTGQPVPNFRLLRSGTDTTGYLNTSRTDAQGRFRFIYPRGTNVLLYWENSSDGNYIMEEGQRMGPAWQGALNADKTDLVLKARLWDTGPLQGLLLDADDKPTSGPHTIYVHSDVKAAVSGPGGRFTLKVAPRDRDFDLFAVNPAKTAGALVHCKAGTTSVTMRMQPLRKYHGEVKSPDGMPATNLKFYIDLKLNGTSCYQVRQEPVTDSTGTFSAMLLPTAKYGVFWSSDNQENRDYEYGNAQIDPSALKPGEPVRFEAKMYVNMLMGKVVDEKDAPIANARISVEDSALSAQNDRNKQITTDKDGKFKIERLAAGKLAFRVSCPRYQTRMLLAATDDVDCVVKMRPAGGGSVARFQVVDGAGAPVTSATLKFYPAGVPKASMLDVMSNPSLTLTTDASGQAEYRAMGGVFGALMGGGNGVCYCCDAPGYELAFGRINNNEDAEVLVRLVKGEGGYSGLVIDENSKPFAGATVTMTGWGALGTRSLNNFGGALGIRAVTDAEGRFVFPRVHKTGSVGYDISAPGYATLSDYYFEGNSEKGPSKLMKPGLLTGIVVDKETGEPVGGVSLYVYGDRNQNANAKSGADGKFKIADLVPGNLTVNANQSRLPGTNLIRMLDSSYERVTLESGQQTSVTLRMVTAIPVSGKIIDAKTGKAPKTQYIIYSRRADDINKGWANGIQTQPDGRWNMSMVPGEHQFGYMSDNGGEMKIAPETLKVEKSGTYTDVVVTIK